MNCTYYRCGSCW